MADPKLWGELIAYGGGVSLSPIHIGLLLLLLLGPRPLWRGGLFLLSWMGVIALMVILLLTVGHGLLLSMDQGSSHRTGLDLIGAGILLAVGIRELLPTRLAPGQQEPPAWALQLDRCINLPLPALIGIAAAIEVVSPDDLLLTAKGAAALLSADLERTAEFLLAGVFILAASLALLVPFLAASLAREQVLPQLERGKELLLLRGDGVVGGLSLLLAAYLAWQGVEGLRIV